MSDKIKKILIVLVVIAILYCAALLIYRAVHRRRATTHTSTGSGTAEGTAQTTTTTTSYTPNADSQAGYDSLPVTYGSNTKRQNPNYVANIQKMLNYWGVHDQKGGKGIAVDGIWLGDTEHAIAELRNFRRHDRSGNTIYGLEDCFTEKDTRALLNGHFFVDKNHYEKITAYYNYDIKYSINQDLIGRKQH